MPTHSQRGRSSNSGNRTRPTVRMGLMPIVAYAFMPDVVHGLLERVEALQISLIEATVQRLIEQLHEGAIDCVVAMLGSARVPADRLTDLMIAPLYQDGLAVACAVGHPLLGAAPVTHAELLQQAWVLAPQATRTRQVVEASFLGRGTLGAYQSWARQPCWRIQKGQVRTLLMLCTWTWSPARMAVVATPMTSPYFRTQTPAAIPRQATLPVAFMR